MVHSHEHALLPLIDEDAPRESQLLPHPPALLSNLCYMTVELLHVLLSDPEYAVYISVTSTFL